MRIWNSFVTLAAIVTAFATTSARGADILYVGDGADNTVKRFDADTGAPLDDADDPFVVGLLGPRGLILDDGQLLVANQNVNLQIPGDVLAFDEATGASLGALVPPTDKHAPFVAWGLIRGVADDLFVSSLSTASGKSYGEILRYDAGTGEYLGTLKTKQVKNKDYHPRSMVFGPDGNLYVTLRTLSKDGLGGAVARYFPDGSSDVLFDDNGGFGRLNRPDGIVFGPDGLLYVMSFSAGPGDADAIRIYAADGTLQDAIPLFDPATQPRVFGQALLFGPDELLYVPISNTGEVRAYDVSTATYDTLVPSTADGGQLLNPLFLTFGQTDPTTLDYVE